MYTVSKNNFYEIEKNSTVYTPVEVSEFIFNILNNEITKDDLVLDPCVGQGSLLLPWKNNQYRTKGIDIVNQGFPNTIVRDFLQMKPNNFRIKPKLIIVNPPFNFNVGLKNAAVDLGFSSRPLMPEVFLKKIIDLFGKSVIIVLFTPYGLRLNVSKYSNRLEKFNNSDYPEISSIISLPKDVYENVAFHSEILIFNSKHTKPHYFIDFKKGDEEE